MAAYGGCGECMPCSVAATELCNNFSLRTCAYTVCCQTCSQVRSFSRAMQSTACLWLYGIPCTSTCSQCPLICPLTSQSRHAHSDWPSDADDPQRLVQDGPDPGSYHDRLGDIGRHLVSLKNFSGALTTFLADPSKPGGPGDRLIHSYMGTSTGVQVNVCFARLTR
jgi:hypothetical protein